MTARSRIWLVINGLEGGGAEKVFVNLAAGLRGLMPGSDFKIILLDDLPHAYEPPAGIPLCTLRARGGYARSALMLSRRAMLERPDLILSFLTRANCASVMAGAVSGAKVVVSERIHTSSYLAGRWAIFHRHIVRALYPRARIIAVSEGVKDDLTQNYAVKASRVSVIYNPLDGEGLRRAAQAAPDIALPAQFIVAVGRLTPVKDYPVLLSAFAASGIADDLVVLGEGPELQRLQSLARDLGISRRVHFCGFVSNPHAIVARSRLYVSASTQEGFPNAHVEAMAVGVPVISTDCKAGPAEILGADRTGQCRAATDAPCGVLVPVGDVAALADALSGMNHARCAAFAARGQMRVAEFSAARAFAAYAQVIAEALQQSGSVEAALPMSDSVRICVAGLRGIPRVQGGVEAHCESLLPRIAARAPHFAFTVISRQPYCAGGSIGPVRISPIWTVRQKHLEAILHTGLAILYAKAVLHPKIMHLHAIGPALWTPLACMLGMRVVVTHHGADYRRAKWGPIARCALRLGEWIAVTRSDAVIAVSSAIAEDLRRRFPAHADRIIHIPNGADPPPAMVDEAIIERLGLQRGRFILSVGRLVPEKGFDDLIEAHKCAETDAPLVIAGGADHEDQYATTLRGLASQKVLLPGRLGRSELAALYRYCGMFVLASHHEGLPIAALEAMAVGARMLLSDIAANAELGLPDASYFPVGDCSALAARLSAGWSDLPRPSNQLDRFNWDDIAERTSAVYRAVAA